MNTSHVDSSSHSGKPSTGDALKIITTYVWPPIPVRGFDWQASYEGREEDGPTAYGATEDEAIQQLRDLTRFADEESAAVRAIKGEQA